MVAPDVEPVPPPDWPPPAVAPLAWPAAPPELDPSCEVERQFAQDRISSRAAAVRRPDGDTAALRWPPGRRVSTIREDYLGAGASVYSTQRPAKLGRSPSSQVHGLQQSPELKQRSPYAALQGSRHSQIGHPGARAR